MSLKLKSVRCSFSLLELSFFFCMQTINDKVARHLLIYLTVQKWLVGDVPFYLRFWIKVSHPVQKNGHFHSPVLA